MKQPKISIVTICFNSENTIEETIKSVLSQNYPLLDYVIIDGGSTDATMQIVNKYRNQLGYVCSEPDKGISDAFNKGVKHAQGDVIGIINSDDILLPGALNAIADAYDGSTDAYRANVMVVNKETGFRGREIPSMTFPLAPLVTHVAHQGTFISQNAYKKWGVYDLNFRYMMDYDLMTRLYQGGAVFKYVNYDVAEFRLGGVSTTPISKKRYDIEHVVLNNGGSAFRATYFYYYMYFFDLAKRLFTKCFGLDALKRLHYAKNS
ncbi:MAG: glycosyltransferase [Bacteroidaceae bacterium]|nr:glycosyltransferase [Bacteroidaceae bacterium]